MLSSVLVEEGGDHAEGLHRSRRSGIICRSRLIVLERSEQMLEQSADTGAAKSETIPASS